MFPSHDQQVGEVYKLDASDDTKMEYIGIIEEAASAAAECIIVVSGKVANFSALTPGKNLYADYLTPGDYTQTEPEQNGTWSINIGKAISVTEVLVDADLAASANFIEESTGSFAIANNQVAPANVTNLVFDGATYRAGFIVSQSRSQTNQSKTNLHHQFYMQSLKYQLERLLQIQYLFFYKLSNQ